MVWQRLTALAASIAFLMGDGAFAADNGRGLWIDTHMHLHGIITTGSGGGQTAGAGQQRRMMDGGSQRRPRMGRGPGGGQRRPMRRGDGPGLGQWRPPVMGSGPGAFERPGMAAGAMPGMQTDYPAAANTLVTLMDRYGVKKALVMPPPQNPGQKGAYEYSALLDAVRKHPGRLFLVGGGGSLNAMIQSIDADDVTKSVRADFIAKAEAIVRAGAKGFGETTAMHLCMSETHHYVATPADHPLFLLLADLSATHGLPIDLHMEAVPEDMPVPEGLARACHHNPATIPATVPPLERLLRHNRGAKVVWQHIGWDNVGSMTPGLMRRLLGEHPNLHLALRAEKRENRIESRETMPNRIVDGNWRLKTEWVNLIRAFPDRFMIGGDEFIGVPGKSRPWPQSFEETWPLLDQLPADLARKVGYANAARVFGLE